MSRSYSSECLSFQCVPATEHCYRLLDALGLPGYRIWDHGIPETLWLRKQLGWRYGTKFILTECWRPCKITAGTDGYQTFWPHIEGNDDLKGKGVMVHRCVLKAFMGPCPPDMEGCHTDGDPSNNNIANLRWDTKRGNQLDAIRHGTQKPAPPGELHWKAKLTDEKVTAIRELYATGRYSQAKLAIQFGMSQPTISEIVRGKIWKHLK